MHWLRGVLASRDPRAGLGFPLLLPKVPLFSLPPQETSSSAAGVTPARRGSRGPNSVPYRFQ